MTQDTLIISGQYLLPVARQDAVIADGGVVVQGDEILAVGPRSSLIKDFPDAARHHDEFGLVMPGLVNTHTHAAMSCLRGFADDLPLMAWLQEHIFPIETKLTPEMVYQATLLSLAEMIKSGTTSFCDMYLFAKDVARAVDQSGMRGWLGEVLYDFPSPCYGELENGFIYIEELFDQYRDHPLINITTNPHAVYTCSPELLQRLGEVAEKHDSIYHIHLSENDSEVNGCRDSYNCSPVEHLDKLGLLSKRTLAAHCVKVDDNEIKILADRGVKVAHCQESNMKLASGIAPVVKMLQQGVTVSIATDGSASNNDVDLFGEMNTVAKIHKVARMDPTVMGAETTLHCATQGGADCLLAGSMIGSLTPGKKADLIVLDLNQPHLTPLYNIPSHLVYAARGGDVIHSMINGRMVMENRQLLTLDEEKILSEMNRMQEKIITLRESS
ncbi:MAG: amidohydrolase [Thermodesulfobacteriota bacterium]